MAGEELTPARDETPGGAGPLGADYTLTVFEDAAGNACGRDTAVRAIVTSYAADGTWLGESFVSFK